MRTINRPSRRTRPRHVGGGAGRGVTVYVLVAVDLLRYTVRVLDVLDDEEAAALEAERLTRGRWSVRVIRREVVACASA